jgi:hypothetical protein
MTAFDLIRRKFRRQLSDLDLLLLLDLGMRGRVRFMDLVESSGASASGVGNALARPMLAGLVHHERINGNAFYSLTAEGKREVAALLGKATPLKKP